MKRIYSILIGLLLLLPLQGQILIHSNYTLPGEPVSPPDFYDEYDTVYAAFGTKPSAPYTTYQEALVYSLDTLDFTGGASVWDRMDVFYVFAANEADNESLINWVKPGTNDADNVSSTAWAQWEGYTGDGAADYISTNFIPSSEGVNYTLDNCAVGVYLRASVAESTWAYGADDGTNRSRLQARNSSGYSTMFINSLSANYLYELVANSYGLFISSRTDANATVLYKGGTIVDTDTDASSGLPTAEFYVLNKTGVAGYSTNQASIFFVMNGIVSEAEATAINTIIEKYMDAIGKGVQ
jgi:hypothetical protein